MSSRIEHIPAFESLQAQIEGDLQPVRPLATTRWLVGFLVFFVPISGTWLWWTRGLRGDYESLGGTWLWGLSAVELVLGTLLLIWILREAIPGRSLSWQGMQGMAATGLGLHVVITLATFAKSPLIVPDGMQWMYGLYCFRFEVVLGSLCLLFTLWLSRRGLTTRPRRVGLLGGLGAGLTADAIWRLLCPYSDLGHAFGAHMSGILTVVLGGLAAAFVWEGWRAKAWRSRSSQP